MALISHSSATRGLGDAINCDHLTHLSPLSKKEEVVTQLALKHLEEMGKARISLGFTARRLLATTLTYASVLSSPFIALISSLWIFSNQIAFFNSWEWALNSGSVLAVVLAADNTVGKLLGIRPITASLVAIYDMHCYTAQTIANRVDESYKKHEQKVQTSYATSRAKLLEELKQTYLGVAEQIKYQRPNDQKLLEGQLSTIRIGLRAIGLTPIEITETLAPLEAALQLALRPVSAKPDAEPSLNLHARPA